MVPVPEADTLEQLNERLLAASYSYGDHQIAGREHSVNELYEEEKNHLIALPEVPFGNLQTATGKIKPDDGRAIMALPFFAYFSNCMNLLFSLNFRGLKKL